MSLQIFSAKTSPREPPKTVKSCEKTNTRRPSTVPWPVSHRHRKVASPACQNCSSDDGRTYPSPPRSLRPGIGLSAHERSASPWRVGELLRSGWQREERPLSPHADDSASPWWYPTRITPRIT